MTGWSDSWIALLHHQICYVTSSDSSLPLGYSPELIFFFVQRSTAQVCSADDFCTTGQADLYDFNAESLHEIHRLNEQRVSMAMRLGGQRASQAPERLRRLGLIVGVA